MECQVVFKKLKQLFAAEPTHKDTNPTEPFVIQADASDVAMGAVLFQKNEILCLHFLEADQH